MSTPTQHRSGHVTSSRGVSAPWWDQARPYLTHAALRESAAAVSSETSAPSTTTSPPLESYPRGTQDCIAADDILSALLGVPGSFVHPFFAVQSQHSQLSLQQSQQQLLQQNGTARIEFTFRHTPAVDPAIPALASQILQLAADHALVAEFAEKNRIAKDARGHIRQALSVAIAELLEDYRMFVLRLEKALRAGNLTMQQLLFYVQPSMRSMALLSRIVLAVDEKTGGAALHAVYQLAAGHVGSPDARAVLNFLVGRAAEPLLDTMHTWLFQGVIHDKYNEFFVEENSRFAHPNMRDDPSASKLWDTRYTLKKEKIPGFLESFAETVLRTGKYVNILREADVDIAALLAEHPLSERSTTSRLMLLGPDASRQIGSLVDRAYIFSTNQVMKYLHEQVNVLGRLRSVKRYFMLEHGDFLVHFLDAAAEELGKPKSNVSHNRLSSLLELSVRTSTASDDPMHDDLGCILLASDLTSQILDVLKADHTGSSLVAAAAVDHSASSQIADQQSLTGNDVFGLKYSVSWPMTLILSSMELLKYQLLFRYLFLCKRVERELGSCWRSHAQVKGRNRVLKGRFARAFMLRHRMLQLFRNVLYYIIADVFEPNWLRFENSFTSAQTVDEIMSHHRGFLDACLSQCLLSNERHIRIFHSVAKVCLLFAAYSEQFTKDLHSDASSQDVASAMETRKFAETIAKFESTFSTNLHKLLDNLFTLSKRRASTHLANLCDRLDYDGFYERSALRSSAALLT